MNRRRIIGTLATILTLGCSPDRVFVEPGASGGQGGSSDGGTGMGGVDGQEDGAPRIITETLPSATFNTDYDFTFNAEPEGALRWSIADDALPNGVTLSESGRVRGLPTEAGEFSFSVTVTTAQGLEATASFTLSVLRKRWLAYVSDEETPDQFLIYVVDVGNNLRRKTLLSTDVQADGDVQTDLKFSYDGSYLAYRVDKTTDEEMALYVVDLRGKTPGQPVLVDAGGHVHSFAWAPHEQALAFAETTATVARLKVSEMKEGTPGDPEEAGVVATSAGTGYVAWPLPDVINLSADGMHDATRGSGGAFSTPSEVSHPGSIERTNPENGRVLYSGWDGCSGRWTVVDYREETSWDLPSWAITNPAITRAARRNGQVFELFPGIRADDAPAHSLSLAIGGCYPWWSPNGKFIVTEEVGEFPDPGPVHFVDVEAGTSSTIPGDGYGPNFGYSGLRISPNSRWVSFWPRELFVSRVTDNQPATWTKVNTAMPTTSDFVRGALFAPNSRSIAYWGEQDTSGKSELFVAGLGSDGPKAPRKLTTNLGAEDDVGGSIGAAPSTFRAVQWSADSAMIAALVEESNGTTTLHLVDVTTPSGTSSEINDNLSCFPEPCQRVSGLMFQP